MQARYRAVINQAIHIGVIAAALALASLADARAEPAAVAAQRVYLNADDPGQDRIGDLRFTAGFALSSPHPRFGGLSGLVVSPDGARATMVSDIGDWVTAGLRHDDDGRLTGIAGVRIERLRGPDGKPLADNKSRRDAEAVERLPDGDLLVSFERRHRLLRYPGSEGDATAPTLLPAPPVLGNGPRNGGLEAIAPLPDGRILAVSEDFRDANGGLRGWLFGPEGATELRYAATGLFKPTDMAVLPDGDVLVLERRYTPIGGAAGRVARIPADQIRPGARLVAQEIARLQPPLTVDNYEGLALRPAAQGGWWLYLLSDDNFNPLQRTLLLQFHWPGG